MDFLVLQEKGRRSSLSLEDMDLSWVCKLPVIQRMISILARRQSNNGPEKEYSSLGETRTLEESFGVRAPSGYRTFYDLAGANAGLVNADMSLDQGMEFDQFTVNFASQTMTGISLSDNTVGRSMCLAISPHIQPMDESADAMLRASPRVRSQSLRVGLEDTISPLQLTCGNALGNIRTSNQLGSSPNRLTMSPILAGGTEYETLILPLQKLRRHLPTPGKSDILGRDRKTSFQGSNQAGLVDIINCEWLRTEVEDLLQWAYRASAKAIDQHAQAKANSGHDAGPSLQSTSHGSECVWSLGIEPTTRNGLERPFRIRPISGILERGTSAMLAIELSLESSGFGSGDTQTAPGVATICSMPEKGKPTTGLIVSFTLSQFLFNARIGPYIKTFNVVPQDPPIIRCVVKK